LKEFCKRLDSIQKTEKEKEKRRNKNRNGPGEPFGPVRGSSPQPRKKTESVPQPIPSSLADVWVPLSGHVIVFLLQPLITPMTSPCSNPPLSLNSH
jgi:hypothetical protein